MLTREGDAGPSPPSGSPDDTGVAATGELRSLSGWANQPTTTSHVIAPATTADVVALASQSRERIARGLGRSYGDAAQIAGGTVFDMTSLTGIWLDARTGVVTIAAGTSLGRVLETVVPNGWFLPVTPGTRHVTVGGAIAADVHGKNHHRSGSFGQYVEVLDLVTADGEVLQVRPGSEIFRATVGGMGLTGIISRATIRLVPIETPWMSVDTVKADHLHSVMETLSEADERSTYSVAWVDLTRSARGRGVVSMGEHAPLEETGPKRHRRSSRSGPGLPRWMPGVVKPVSVALFNGLWFSAAPRREEGRLQAIDDYFYPLDRVADWNRLYGRTGFLQYQFVVPDDEEETLLRVAEELTRSSTPVALAVLKRLGPSHGGHLSFPIPGWTLAVDMPLGDHTLAGVLDRCDRAVAGAGGRVYLAKDSRLRAGLAHEMYPTIGDWREVRSRLDPGDKIRSNLSRRLDLTG